MTKAFKKLIFNPKAEILTYFNKIEEADTVLKNIERKDL